MNKQATIIKCPTCKKSLQWRTDNPYRPFCSHRCRLIDLGAWASEENKLPGEPVYDGILSEDLNSPHDPDNY